MSKTPIPSPFASIREMYAYMGREDNRVVETHGQHRCATMDTTGAWRFPCGSFANPWSPQMWRPWHPSDDADWCIEWEGGYFTTNEDGQIVWGHAVVAATAFAGIIRAALTTHLR